MRSRDTALMEKIRDYAEEYALQNMGMTPSTREIGAALGLHYSRVFRHLEEMDRLGMIRYQDGIIHTEKIDRIRPATSLCPAFVNAIPAGPAEEVEAYAEEYIAIPSVFTDGRRGRFYLLRVSGSSMIDAGIDSGDLVIIRGQEDAREGDVVAALVNGTGSTLKRLCRDEKGRYLRAENNAWSKEERFYGRQFAIQGVVIKVVKDFA